MIRDSERSVAINRQSGQHRITTGVPEACCNGLYNTACLLRNNNGNVPRRSRTMLCNLETNTVR